MEYNAPGGGVYGHVTQYPMVIRVISWIWELVRDTRSIEGCTMLEDEDEDKEKSNQLSV